MTFIFAEPGDTALCISRNGKELVRIYADGTVVLGDGVSNDVAARAFWDAVLAMSPFLATIRETHDARHTTQET